MKLTRKEIKEMVVLDALCFNPPINFSYRDMLLYTNNPEAILIREYAGDRLIAFCLGEWGNGNIVTIDVHPEHRRCGLGRKLLNAMLHEFKSRKTPFAVSQIALDNIASLKLHKDLGFEIRHILQGYYPDGSAAYELVLPLNLQADSHKRTR